MLFRLTSSCKKITTIPISYPADPGVVTMLKNESETADYSREALILTLLRTAHVHAESKYLLERFVDKELDPLRELEPAADRDELPPTTEFRSKSTVPPVASQSRTSPSASQRRPQNSGSGSGGPRLPAVNYPPSGGVRSRYGSLPQVRITENIVPQQHIRFGAGMGPTLSVFVLGIIVAVLTIGILRSGSSVPLASKDAGQFGGEGAIGHYLNQKSFIDPLFGQFAVKKCVERCDLRTGPTKTSCIRGCNMYNLSIYGRRVTLDKFDSNADAAEIINRCVKRNAELEVNSSGSGWYDDIKDSLSLIDETPEIIKNGEFTRVRAQYHKLLDANSRLRLPPGGTAQETELAQSLLRSTCLQANAALTSLAIGTAVQNSDQFSARYFRQISEGLQNKTAEVSLATLTQAKSLKLY
jgi:hypothetical protein